MYVLCAEDKKEDIRSKVWNYLDQNKLTQLFAPYKKISNFKVWLVECSLSDNVVGLQRLNRKTFLQLINQSIDTVLFE